MFEVSLRRAVLSTALVLVATPAVQAAPRATVARFDGAWSVVIVTDSGPCDRAYRYGLRIESGRVLYPGGSGVDVTGRVDAAGRVLVEVRGGGAVAHGSGRLSGSSGAGRWEGRLQDQRCAGRWQAQRGGG
jgi:hypothetical protein